MSATLHARIESEAYPATLDDGASGRLLGADTVMELAESMGVPGRIIETAALEHDIIPVRYLRNRKTLSRNDQITLLKASVGIIGLGGLGGLVTDSLARLGVGRLHLVDGDRFEAHNLNRQLLSGTGTIGTFKADAATAHVAAINPGIEVFADNRYLSAQNADRLVGTCDLVVDCLDNIPSRFTLESAAGRAGIPMVSAAIAGLAGHITTIYPGDMGLKNVYGPQDRLKTTRGEEVQLGCLAPGVNLLATLECAEIIKILLKRPGHLRNRLLVVDLNDYSSQALELT